MEQRQYLIDTNSVIDYLGKKLSDSGMFFMNDVINATPIVSVITKIEVLGFNAPKKNYRILSEFMDDSIVLNISDEVVDSCIEIRKRYKTKLPDAIIAATALVYDLDLITRNIADFKNIEGLTCINPHNFQ